MQTQKKLVPEHQKRRSKMISKKFDRTREESKREVERARILLRDDAGGIQVENDLEKTWKAKQKDILQDADDNTRAKVLDLRLNQKYSIKFARNGRHLVMGGEKGHLAVVDALRSHVKVEVNLENEMVHAVTPLHNETMFAAAQKKYVYIYDHAGTEVHQLRSHIEPRRLEFLPYHFLLASVGRSSRVVYQDVSTGSLVASLRTRMGPCSILAQNPKTGVLATGHSTGVVAMWAPTNGDALIKVLCHPAPITAVAFERSGLKMATSGLDGRVSIWDVRNLGSRLNSYTVRSPRVANCLAVSDTGLLAVGTSSDEVTIWKDVFGEEKQKDPYLSHHLPSGQSASCLDFRPFEDILGIGHSSGIQTIVVPGAGEANYDAFEANPFERKNQRRETEVRKLLDKLPADTIGMDQIGAVFSGGEQKAQTYLDKLLARAKRNKQSKTSSAAVPAGEAAAEDESIVLKEQEHAQEDHSDQPAKKKMKGRGKIGSRLKVKHRNIITVEREKRRLAEESKGKQAGSATVRSAEDVLEAAKPGQAALNRFKKIKRSSE